MRKYEAIIFDLDGTLLDTLADLTDAVNYALTSMDMPGQTMANIRQYVGNGIENLVSLVVPSGCDEAKRALVLQRFQVYYQLHCRDKTKPYPGIIDLLKRLKSDGYALAIVSNKPDFAVKELNQIFFKDYVSVALGECAQIARKPQPDMVLAALSELGVAPARAIYVGDSEVDLLTAKNASLPCLSVLWGFRDKTILVSNGAKQLVDLPEEIMGLLSKD
jgi:phosphoglycolate phosphatase